MKLKFEKAGFEYTCKSISQFFSEGGMEDFQEYICEVYPSIMLEEIKSLNGIEKEAYIKNKIKKIYLSTIINSNFILRTSLIYNKKYTNKNIYMQNINNKELNIYIMSKNWYNKLIFDK